MYGLSGGLTTLFSIAALLSRSYRDFLRYEPPAPQLSSPT
jgi:hypothetical protein